MLKKVFLKILRERIFYFGRVKSVVWDSGSLLWRNGEKRLVFAVVFLLPDMKLGGGDLYFVLPVTCLTFNINILVRAAEKRAIATSKTIAEAKNKWSEETKQLNNILDQAQSEKCADLLKHFSKTVLPLTGAWCGVGDGAYDVTGLAETVGGKSTFGSSLFMRIQGPFHLENKVIEWTQKYLGGDLIHSKYTGLSSSNKCPLDMVAHAAGILGHLFWHEFRINNVDVDKPNVPSPKS